MTSAGKPSLAKHASALVTQIATVLSSSRQGITAVTFGPSSWAAANEDCACPLFNRLERRRKLSSKLFCMSGDKLFGKIKLAIQSAIGNRNRPIQEPACDHFRVRIQATNIFN